MCQILFINFCVFFKVKSISITLQPNVDLRDGATVRVKMPGFKIPSREGTNFYFFHLQQNENFQNPL